MSALTDQGNVRLVPVEDVDEDEFPVYEDDNDDVVAAGEVHTGAMIAFIPSDADRAALAVEEGEPRDELHITARYLGEAVNFTRDDRAALVDAVHGQFRGVPAAWVDCFAVAVFNPPGTQREDGQEFEPCVVLIVNGSVLADWHGRVARATDVLADRLPDPLVPWIPHITLVYADDVDVHDLADRTGPVLLDTVRVAFGGDVYDIPLGEPAGAPLTEL